jgi:hypothetical protein
LSNVFHDVIGMPLRDCLRDIQLKRAHELLLGSTLSLSTLASMPSFYDLCPTLTRRSASGSGWRRRRSGAAISPRGNG